MKPINRQFIDWKKTSRKLQMVREDNTELWQQVYMHLNTIMQITVALVRYASSKWTTNPRNLDEIVNTFDISEDGISTEKILE